MEDACCRFYAATSGNGTRWTGSWRSGWQRSDRDKRTRDLPGRVSACSVPGVAGRGAVDALVAGSIVSFPGAPRRRVVVSFPLSTSAAESLQRSVGEAFELVDIRKPDGSESVVVVSSVSRQLLAKLRTAFADASLFVVEVDDDVHHVDLAGPVIRALDAGAHGYLVARSVDELGDAIARAVSAGDRSVSSEPIALAVAPVDEIDKVLDAIIRNRARARQRQAEK